VKKSIPAIENWLAPEGVSGLFGVLSLQSLSFLAATFGRNTSQLTVPSIVSPFTLVVIILDFVRSTVMLTAV